MKEESEKKMDVSLRIEALLLLLYEKILLLFELLYVLVLLYVWLFELLFDFLTLKLLLRCLEGGDNEGDFDKILPMLLL